MALSSPGIGSNLDVNSIVTQLMALERRPLTQLDSREANYQAQLSAYGALKGAVSTFQSALAGLRDPARFDGVRAQSANTAIVAATAASTAAAGTYTVTVNTLAVPQVLQSAGLTNTTTAGSTGTITLQAGSGAAHVIAVDAANNTLEGVRNAINAAQTDVQASIVNDGSATPYRLVLTSANGGTANTLTVTNTLTAGAVKDALDSLTEAQAAVNAGVTVNGVSITGAGNQLTEAIPGVTLTLGSTGTTTVNVNRDTSGIQSAVQSFVKAYNDLTGTVSALTAFNPTTRQAGLLAGNSAAIGVQTRLRAIVGGDLAGLSGNLTRLSQIGVEFDRTGKLTLNAATLSSAIESSPADIGALFTTRGRSDNILIEYAGAGTGTAAGTYEVDVTAAATRAQLTATTAPAASTVIDGSNNTFSFTLDGVASGNLQIASGTYTPAQLAGALQSAVDSSPAFASASIAATVALEGGRIAITSARYGAASNASLAAGSAIIALGFTGSEAATGVDAAGEFRRGGTTIAATGSGRSLISTDGLAVKFNGDAAQLQAGAEGNVTVSRGYAVLLDELATRLLDADGVLENRSQGVTKSIEDIGKRRASINSRLIDTENRLRAQFAALDTLISRLNSTSSFLTQQLANLPVINSSNN
ncbi:MAG: flagellar filament capping protein FliD [Burkholderiales bacterium]